MANARTLVVTVDDGDGFHLSSGPIENLCEILKAQAYGMGISAHAVHTLDERGDLVKVTYVTTDADYDAESSLAYPLVTVTYPDGATESCRYVVDGRA